MNHHLMQWKSVSLIACTLMLGVSLQAQDLPRVRLRATDPSALSGTTGGAFTLIRHGDTNDALTVTVDISGTAANGVDYAPISTVLILPPGYLAVDIPVQPIADTVNRGNKTVVLTVQPSAAYTIAGSAKATVKIVDDVFDIPPPTVSMSSPADGSVFSLPATVTLQADVSDTELAIAGVSFYANDNFIGRVTNSPYTLVWTKSQAGKYAFFARAEDQLGKSAVSDPVHVTLSATPVVTLNVADGSTFRVGANVTLQAQFGDPNETIKSVNYLVNGKSIGTSTTAPFSVNWVATPRGTYTLQATAVDLNTGKKGSSDKITVTVAPDLGN
jgi:Bacterial Ig domain